MLTTVYSIPRLVSHLCLLLLLASCGGGGGTNNTTGTSNTLSGTAATGAPLAGLINVTGSAGAQTLDVAIASDGSFSANVDGLMPPFIIQAVPTDTTQPTLFSYAADVNVTVNVTPLTNLSMFMANTNSDPSTLYSNWLSIATGFSAQLIRNAQAIINANLQNLFQSAGLNAFVYDFFSSSFNADGSGFDALLDDVIVDISGGTANVTVPDDLGFTFDTGIDTTGFNIGVDNVGPVTYTIGGTISGATGSLGLLNNGGDDLQAAAASFTFETALANGATYDVTVASPPTDQSCTVSNESGTVDGANINDILVACMAAGGSATYTVGGTISGLSGMISLELLKNGVMVDDLPNFSNSIFIFSATFDDGNTYAVTILEQPAGQTCTPGGATGTINGADVTDVSISCVDVGGNTGSTSATLSVNPAQYFDFSAGIASESATAADIIGVNNEGVNFGNEGATGITGRRVIRLAASGSLNDVPVIPEWSDAAPWVGVSYDFTDGTQGLPVAVGEIWAVYTSEGHYAVLQITGLPGGGFGDSFTFDYLYNADGTRIF